jgi:hypothetical protein
LSEIFDTNYILNDPGNTLLFRKFLERLKDSNFHPDITGYSLIYLVPPDIPLVSDDNPLFVDGWIPFLAIDFTPPESNLHVVEESSGGGNVIPYATRVARNGSLSLTFIEDSNLRILDLHNYWVGYIDDLIKGRKDPPEEYMNEVDSAELCYATSAYIAKFKPDMRTLTYLGKAVGVFPINIPAKEVIGNRQSNELSTVTVNYTCAYYGSFIPNSIGQSGEINNWIFEEFKSDLMDHFKMFLSDNVVNNDIDLSLSSFQNPNKSSVLNSDRWYDALPLIPDFFSRTSDGVIDNSQSSSTLSSFGL